MLLWSDVTKAGALEAIVQTMVGYRVFIAGILPEGICLVDSYDGCGTGGYTFGGGTTIQKEIYDGKFVLDQILAHEVGHAFGLGDAYDAKGAKPKTDKNPPPTPLIGRHTGQSGTQELEDTTKSFISREDEVQWHMAIRNTTTGAWTLAQLVHNNTIKTQITWNNGDGYSIFNDGNSEGKWLRYGGNAFNVSYSNDSVQARTPVFYSWLGQSWCGFMGNHALSSSIGTWAEPNEYSNLFQGLKTGLVQLRTAKLERLSSERLIIFISGIIAKDDAISVNPFAIENSDIPIPQSSGVQYAVIFCNKDLAELKRVNFDVYWEMSTPEGVIELASGPFSIITEFPSDCAIVRIVKLPDEKQLFARASSSTEPSVTLLYPNGGEHLEGLQTITWQSYYSGSLTYSLFYSNDNGASFSSLANNLVSTNCEIDFDSLGGGNECFIRVTASDGFNQAEDRNNSSFSVEDKPPLVQIAAPSNNAVFRTGDKICFSGNGYDLEDGLLSGSNLEWKSSISGILGTGKDLVSILAEGTHLITLRAYDSQGATTSSTITVRVGDRDTIPIADAGHDRNVFCGDIVVLDGTASHDPNGDSLTYLWEQISGPSVSLDNLTSPQPKFIAPAIDKQTMLQFRLNVSDGTNNGVPDIIAITVLPPATPTPTRPPTETPTRMPTQGPESTNTPVPTATSTPLPTAVIELNSVSFSTGEQLTATFRVNEALGRTFNAYAVVIMPDGSMLDMMTLKPKIEPVATDVPSLPAGFTFPLLSVAIPPGAPKGEYELLVAFFDPNTKITGRQDAFLQVSAKFEIN